LTILITQQFLDHTTVNENPPEVIMIMVVDNSDHRTSHHTTVLSFEKSLLIEVIMILLICL